MSDVTLVALITDVHHIILRNAIHGIRLWRQVVVICPHCTKQHFHHAGPTVRPLEKCLGKRFAHCVGVADPLEYEIQLSKETLYHPLSREAVDAYDQAAFLTKPREAIS